MMWDFSGGNTRRNNNPQHLAPQMQMPAPSFPISAARSDPTAGRTSPYPQAPLSHNPGGFVPPSYMLPQYEQSAYYGTNSQMISPSYAPAYIQYPQPQPVQYQRERAHSHSHPQHHSHSHSPSHHHHSKQHGSGHHHHYHHHGSAPVPLPIRPSSAEPPPVAKTPRPSPSHHKLQSSQSFQPLNGQFRYSKCTGRKKALCIGINYLGQPNQLRGCINDAKHVRDFLTSRGGFISGDIVILTDDSTNPRKQPTRKNIIDAMKWLVHNAQPHDSLFFHYSGHGGQTRDLNGDEIDGWDEVIFPVDFKKNGHIVDDDMHAIMVKPLPPGCRLTALFDSCHSGSVLDLPYIYSSHGRLKGSQVTSRFQKQLSSPADVISWSACKDGQTSSDTFAGGVAVGAMSYAFITAMTRQPRQSYQDLLRSIRLILHPRFSQKPQLGSSHHIDTSLQFII